MNYNDFSVQRVKGMRWRLINEREHTSVTFFEGRYTKSVEAEQVCANMKEFEEAAHSEYLDWLTECDHYSRFHIVCDMTDNMLREALENITRASIGTDFADEYAFPEDFEKIFPHMSAEMKHFVEWATGDEFIELIKMVACYQTAPYDVQQWIDDLRTWTRLAHKEYIRQLMGIRIQELRIKKGYTPQELAERVGVKVNQIKRIEEGAYAVDIAVIDRIALALGGDLEIELRSDSQNGQE